MPCRTALAAIALVLAVVVPTSTDGLELGPSTGLSLEPRPSFPLFGGGKFVNTFEDDRSLTNASAHVAWSLAVPLIGERLGGRRGMWVAGVSWIALTLTQESFFHAPPNPGPGYASEFRSDLITRIVPCAAVLIWDLVRHRND